MSMEVTIQSRWTELHEGREHESRKTFGSPYRVNMGYGWDCFPQQMSEFLSTGGTLCFSPAFKS